MASWRAPLRWILAAVVLELVWLFAAESWRERESMKLLAVVGIAGPLVSAAWHSVLKPSGLQRSLLGALLLAAAGLATSLVLDLVSPYPPRFAMVRWELLRAAALVAGFALGAATTRWRASPAARPTRIARIAHIGGSALCAASVIVALLVPAAVLYIVVDGSRDSGSTGDTALVLGYALAPDGSAQPQMIGRVAHAVTLLQRGRVRRLVLSGGVARNGRTEAAVMRDLAIAAGVPASAIVLELDSRSTIENFACGRRLLAELSATRVLLVTEPWHMTRAMLLARRHGLSLEQSPATSAIWESPRHAAYWLFRDAVALIRERMRDPFASPGVCGARECEGCRTF